MKKIQRRSRSQNTLEELEVKQFFFDEKTKLPRVFQATYPGLDLKNWVSKNRTLIQNELNLYGAVLFRNFSNTSISDFDKVVRSWNPDLMDYDFGSTPRQNLQEGIFTSTEYPADQEIFMHNEMAYTNRYPAYLWFYCHLAAEEGGCTPLASNRTIFETLGQEITTLFEEKKLLYVRNYRPGMDVPWQQVFRTTDKEVVSDFCQKNKIDFEWVTSDHLRTKEKCEAIVQHPITGEKIWFNQAHLFHPSNLGINIRSQLSTMDEKDYPRNVFLGTGEPINPDHLEKVRAAFESAKLRFDWMPGDMVLIDNLLAAHGRDPYKGARKIMVAMQGALTRQTE